MRAMPCSNDVIDVMYDFLLLAQAAPDAAPAAADDSNQLFRLAMPLVAMMVLFYFMLIRPQRRREQQLREMVQNVKENDRVVTVGGIYGVVTNVQRDADRVTLRIDESNGTKIKLNLSAIARVITGEEKETAGAPGNNS